MQVVALYILSSLYLGSSAPAPPPLQEGSPRFRHEQQVARVSFSADGKTLLGDTSISRASASRLWEAGSGKPVSQFRGKILGQHPAFSPDGKWLVDVTDSTARLWDFVAGKVVRSWGKETKPESKDDFVVSWAYFSRDSRILAIQGKKKDKEIIRRFDLKKGAELRAHEVEDAFTHHLAMSPDGMTLIGRHENDRSGSFLDLDSGKKRHSLEKWSADYHHGLAFTPDGKTVACVEDQSVVLVWDVATGKLVRQLKNDKRGFFGFRGDPFSPDSKLLAVNDGSDRNVLIYELATGKLLRSVNNGRGEQCFNLFSPNNQLLATFSDGARTICVWELASGKKLSTFAFELDQIWSGAMAFSPDSNTLAFASGRYIKLGDVHTGKEIQSGNEKKE